MSPDRSPEVVGGHFLLPLKKKIQSESPLSSILGRVSLITDEFWLWGHQR